MEIHFIGLHTLSDIRLSITSVLTVNLLTTGCVNHKIFYTLTHEAKQFRKFMSATTVKFILHKASFEVKQVCE